jgi:hypothetical protein
MRASPASLLLPLLPLLQLPPCLHVNLTMPGQALLPMLRGLGCTPGQVRCAVLQSRLHLCLASQASSLRDTFSISPWCAPALFSAGVLVPAEPQRQQRRGRGPPGGCPGPSTGQSGHLHGWAGWGGSGQ